VLTAGDADLGASRLLLIEIPLESVNVFLAPLKKLDLQLDFLMHHVMD